MSGKSRIFQRNRALGFVSNHVPCITRYISSRHEHLVTTVVGRSLHTYGSNKFSLLNVGGYHNEDITCIAGDAFRIYSCCDKDIYAWKRGCELTQTFKGHVKPVHIIQPWGPFLISVDEDNILKVWDSVTGVEVLEYPFHNDAFQVTAIVHPHTYINKMLLGSKQGSMQLLNIHTSKLIYNFHGWDCEITVLEQAPAIDVIAVGLSNGKIILHNIKYDESLMELTQDWGAVTCISFRTDGPPVMVTGSLVGHIILWNLEEKKPMTQILNAHHAAVSSVKCLSNEPLMITSSPDNSLKMWIFDKEDGGARLYCVREGHSKPPTFIRYHGSDGHNIVSAGGDSTLRIFSTITETFNKSLGKATYKPRTKYLKRLVDDGNLYMPPIISFSSETAKEKEWDDIAAVHLGLPIVTTWSYGNLKMGDLRLKPESIKHSKYIHQVCAMCVFVTSCGNFVLIGYSSGIVHKFNIESGYERGSYGNPKAHEKPVRGVCSDSLNQVVITGGSDCCVKFWNFKHVGEAALTQVDVQEGVLAFHLHGESSLLAIALEDYQVLVMDLDTRLIIRRFAGHTSQLTDMAFSPDAHWLVTAAMDRTIRTWDIPSAHLIDIFEVDTPCTSVTFSPTGDKLATAHVDSLGIYLWSNRCIFENISLSPVRDLTNVPLVPLPSTGRLEQDDDVLEVDEPIDSSKPVTIEQISKDLVTLSQVPNSRWQNLLNIELIWKKNKPKSLVKKPQVAPFFLPTIPSLEMQFDLNADKGTNDEKSENKLQLSSATGFQKLLAESTNFEAAIAKLKELSPSVINFELTALAPEGGGSIQMMYRFLKLIETMLESNKDFELSQSYLALFLKKHGETIASETLLCNQLKLLQTLQENSWKALQSKLMYCLCVTDALKAM